MVHAFLIVRNHWVFFSLENHLSRSRTLIQPLSLNIRADESLYEPEKCMKRVQPYYETEDFSSDDITMNELVSKLQDRIKTIPFHYLQRNENMGSSCGRIPSLEILQMNNEVWQRFQHAHITLYLFSAHLDVRELNPHPTIRVFVTMSRPEIDEVEFPYCQIWEEDATEPHVVQASNFQFTGWDGIWNKSDNSNMNTPHMFECLLAG